MRLRIQAFQGYGQYVEAGVRDPFCHIFIDQISVCRDDGLESFLRDEAAQIQTPIFPQGLPAHHIDLERLLNELGQGLHEFLGLAKGELIRLRAALPGFAHLAFKKTSIGDDDVAKARIACLRKIFSITHKAAPCDFSRPLAF